MLTSEVSSDIAIALKAVEHLDQSVNFILLGPIPVMDEDGLEILGHLVSDDQYRWRFEPSTSDSTPTQPAPTDSIDELAERRERLNGRAVDGYVRSFYGLLDTEHGSKVTK